MLGQRQPGYYYYYIQMLIITELPVTAEVQAHSSTLNDVCLHVRKLWEDTFVATVVCVTSRILNLLHIMHGCYFKTFFKTVT